MFTAVLLFYEASTIGTVYSPLRVMKANEASEPTTEQPPIISRAKFARQIGRTTLTLWRWERAGILDPAFNLCGKPFYKRESIETFTRRAAAGEFAKASHAPRKEKAAA